jgi:energy-coupling factor transport system ATP-binding protein
MGTGTPVIEVKDLYHQYAGTKEPALDWVSLAVYAGDFLGIMGPNGAGKTTLCLHLNGLIPHMIRGGRRGGSVRVFDMDTNQQHPAELALRVGMIFQEPESQLSQITVEEEIAFGLENIGVPRDEMLRRIKEALDIVGLSGMELHSPFQLSGGQQQLLAIASVVAMEPEVLVMDEPTSQLDPIGTQNVFAAVSRLVRERGYTVIMVEHKVEELAEHATRLLVLNEGKVFVEGPPREVLSRAADLQSIGLVVPEVTQAAWKLDKDYRLWTDPYPIRREEAYYSLVRMLERGHHNKS